MHLTFNLTYSYLKKYMINIKVQFIALNGIFIFIFFMISQLVDLQITLGGVPFYK